MSSVPVGALAAKPASMWISPEQRGGDEPDPPAPGSVGNPGAQVGRVDGIAQLPVRRPAGSSR